MSHFQSATSVGRRLLRRCRPDLLVWGLLLLAPAAQGQLLTWPYLLQDLEYVVGVRLSGHELPVAQGGGRKLTYTLTATTSDGIVEHDLPAGLRFYSDEYQRLLWGTPTAAGTYRMTYTATLDDGAGGNSITARFNLIVHPAAALFWASRPDDREYLADRSIEDWVLPQANGGIGAKTYSLTASTGDGTLNTEDLPAGLSFDATTRTLSGTPTATGSYLFAWSVEDEAGTVLTLEFELYVSPALVLEAPDARELLAGRPIDDWVLPQASGGSGTLTYALSAETSNGTLNAEDLPAGLEFVAASRTLSGTPTAAGTYRLTWSVTDLNDNTTSATFDLVVHPALVWDELPLDEGYPAGQPIGNLVLPQASGGIGALTFSLEVGIHAGPLDGDLPAGLSFAAASRTLSGTPTAAGSYLLIYSATDTAGNVLTADFELFFFVSTLSLTSPGAQSWLVGQSAELELAAATGSTGTPIHSLTVTTLDGVLNEYVEDEEDEEQTGVQYEGMPAGLTFYAYSRTLSGTPAAPGTYRMTYSAADSSGNIGSVTFDLVVHPALVWHQLPEERGSPINQPIGDMVLPQASGGSGGLTYSLAATTDDGTVVDGLPAGLEFVAASRTLSGTPTAAGTYALAYSVEDEDGHSLSETFALIFFVPVLSLASPGDQTWLVGRAEELQLAQVTGSTETLTHRLSATTSDGTLFNGLPAGLRFVASSRTLSGTPTAAGTYSMSYRAGDLVTNSASATFELVVRPALVWTTEPEDLQHRTGQPANLELSQASGGIGALTYSLSLQGDRQDDGQYELLDLPAWMEFDADTRRLSGTPAAAGSYLLIYSVTDTGGNVLTAQIELFIHPALGLPATLPNRQYLVGSEIETLELPQATGGSGTLTYSLTATTLSGTLVKDLPAGLEFFGRARRLSGTPTAPGNYSMTYRVVDGAGGEATATFVLSVRTLLNMRGLLNRRYHADRAVELRLPFATGGVGTLTYRLQGTSEDGTVVDGLPAGLSFDATSRTLSGTPTVVGRYSLTYSATDEADNSVERLLIVRIYPALSWAFAPPTGGEHPTEWDFYVRLPAARGGSGDLTYSLTATTADGVLNEDGALQYGDDMPAGTGFFPQPPLRTDSLYTLGRPTAPGTYRLTYRVVDEEVTDSGLEATYQAVIYPGVVWVSDEFPTVIRLDWLLGQSIDMEMPLATGGRGPLRYNLYTDTTDGVLDEFNKRPAGLSFNRQTRRLSGSPTAAGTYSIRYTAYDENGSGIITTWWNVVVHAMLLDSVPDGDYLNGHSVDLQLPAATGGAGALTYSLLTANTATGSVVDGLPAGLSFDAATRRLTGTLTSAGTYPMTYQVEDEDNNVVTADFVLTVHPELTLEELPDLDWIDGGIINTRLPSVAGGIGGLTYSLTATTDDGELNEAGDLPDGLRFTARNRRLTGVPTTPGTYSMTYSAEDSEGNRVEGDFDIVVHPALTLAKPAEASYLNGDTVNLVLPQAAGGIGNLTYSLIGTRTSSGSLLNGLPSALNFASDSRTLSGQLKAAGGYSLRYTATDEANNSVTVHFGMVVHRALRLTRPRDRDWLQGKQIQALTLPAATGGAGSQVYSLSATTGDGDLDGGLPAGMRFDAASRELSGTPTAPGTYSMTYSAREGASHSASEDFSIQVHPALVLPALPPRGVLVNTSMNGITLPEATGGIGSPHYLLSATIVDGGTLSGSRLPFGLGFVVSTRRLIGRPTVLGTYRLTYTAVDDHNNRVESSFDFVVHPQLSSLAPPSAADRVWMVGRPIGELQLSQATGGVGNLTYSLTATTPDGTGTVDNGLPAGLSFDPASRTLSGTPTTAGNYYFSYRAVDQSNNGETTNFSVVVHPALTLGTLPGQEGVKDSHLDLRLPQGSGGIGARSYSLTATSSDGTTLSSGNLPAGLGFAAGSRRLLGTPTVAGPYRMTYSVTDAANNVVSEDFDLVIHPELTLPRPADRTWRVGKQIQAVELPQANGGYGRPVYTLSATTSDGTLASTGLPAGLGFDPTTRRLLGTPTAEGTYRMILRARDGRANTEVEQAFEIVIRPVLSLDMPSHQNWLAGKQNQAVQLPQADGGVGALTYSLLTANTATGSVVDGLPAGLSFDAATRRLSGTPTAAGTYRLTLRVEDADNNEAERTFRLVVHPALSWASPPEGLQYLADRAIGETALPQAAGGIGALTYSLTATNSDGALAGDLPAGLGFDAATRRLSGTPTAAGTYRLVYSATDDEGNRLTADFALAVRPALAWDSTPVVQEYRTGRAMEPLLLPTSAGGIGTPTYSLEAIAQFGTLVDGLPPGLSFAADSHTLSGTPTAAGTWQMTWIATDSNGNSIRLVFRIRAELNQAPLFAARAQIASRNWLTGSPIEDMVLPPAEGGNGALVYRLEATTAGGTPMDELPAGLGFNPMTRVLSGTPTAVGRYNMIYSATDTDGDRAVLQFTVQALQAQQVEAMVDGEIRQSSALALAGSVGQSMVHRLETFAAGDLLAPAVDPGGSSLSLPLKVAGAEGAVQQQGGGLAFWLQSSQQQLENRTGLQAWDGEVEETRLGLDGKVGRNLLLGLMVSRSEGVFDYDGVSGALQGQYQSELELVGPYLGWTGDSGLNLWAMLSSGQGQIGAPDEGGEPFDLSMGLLGLDWRLLSNRTSEFRLRAELSSLDLEYGSADRLDNAELLGEAAMVSETWQMRLVAETSHRFRTTGGASWTPAWQLAFRDSNHEQALGTGIELGGSIGYRSANSLFTAEVGARMLDAETAGYKESGSYLLLRLQTSSDKRGLSFSLSPTRGQVASRIEELWDRQKRTLLTDPAAAARAEDASEIEKMVGELGYGIAWGSRFLLTPYSRFGLSQDSRSWAFGTRWQTGKHFTLSLESHGEASGHSDPSHGIRLKAKLDF